MQRLSIVLLLACIATSAKAQEPEAFTVTALTEPVSRVKVKARVDGYVTRCLVGAGSTADVGSTLVEIAVPELDAKVSRARAALAQTEAHLLVLSSDQEIALREHAISEREERVAAGLLEQTQKTLAVHQGALARAKLKLKSGQHGPDQVAAAQALVLKSEAAYKASGEKVKNTQDRIEISKLRMKRTGRILDEARQQVEVKRAELQMATVRADQAVVRNLVPGALVSRVRVSEGALVRAGETELVELMDTSRMRIVVHIPQRLIHRVQVGTKATIHGVGTPLHTKIFRRGGYLAPQSKTMRYEIEIPNDGDRWVPGLLCEVRIELEDE